MQEKIIKQLKDSSVFLILFLVIILLFTTILWFIGIPITRLHLPIEFLISCGIFLFYNIVKRKNKRITLIIKNVFLTIILAGIVFTFSTICSTKFYDTTSDGNTYHKVAVGSMKNGWIPLQGSSKDYTEEKGNVVSIQEGNRNYLWVDHYANGTEIIGANIYKFTNRIESGKAFNMIIIYSGFGILLYILLNNTKLGKIKSVLIAFVLVVNPITINQVWTYYVDTTLMISLFIALAEMILISKNRKIKNYIVLFLALILCIESKFTGAAYAAVFSMGFLTYWIIKDWKNKKWKNIRFNIIFYIVLTINSVFIIGCSTYLMNFINHKSFLYPLYGENHVENMVNMEIPKNLSKQPNFVQFLVSVFSKGDNVTPAYATIATEKETIKEPKLKVPLSFSTDELNNYTIPDLRIGGFGILFSGIYIFTTLMGIYLIVKYIRNKRIKEKIPFLIITLISYALLFLLDGGYWARYIPYIYFVQVMNLVYFINEIKEKKYEFISWMTLIFLLINSWMIGNVSIRANIQTSRNFRDELFDFIRYSKENRKNEIELQESNQLGILYNLDDFGFRGKLITRNNDDSDEKKNNKGFIFKNWED